MPTGNDRTLLELVAQLVPLAADAAAVDLRLGNGPPSCVAAVHMHPDGERGIAAFDPAARANPRMTIPFDTARGNEGTLTIWSGRALSPLEEAFACSVGGHIAAVLDARAAERAQRELESTREQFLSMVGHELRAPLQSMMIGLQLVRMRASDTADELPRGWVVERCERLERSTERLTALADRLLELTRLSGGELPLTPTDAELGEIVAATVDRHRDALLWTATDVRIEQESPLHGAWDVMHVDTIVSNLITNAAKYAAGAPIDIAVKGDPERVRIVVRDHGPGIDDEDRPRIFDRFARGRATSTVAGLGLGLWLARSLAEAQGGSLDVTDPPGGGSAFVIELPRRVRSQAPARAPS